MRLYTRSGDKGQTSVIGGRLDKDALRVEAYGTLDEANSFIGKAVAELDQALFKDIIVFPEFFYFFFSCHEIQVCVHFLIHGVLLSY